MDEVSGFTSPRRDSDQSKSFWFLGTQMTLKATGQETAGSFGLIEQVLPPGFAAPPHVHHAEDEAFYVLTGDFTFFRGDEVLPAGAGSFVWLPRNLPHWFRVEGDTPARLLQWNLPAGLENFFAELGQPITDLATPPNEPPDFTKLMALAPRYEMEIRTVPAHEN